MLYAFIMSRFGVLNSCKTWNVPLCKVYGVQGVRLRPPFLQAPYRTQKEGGNGGVPLGAAPDLHCVDLHRSVHLDSVLFAASNIEDPGRYKMA